MPHDQSEASRHTDLTNEQLTLTAAGDLSAGHHRVLQGVRRHALCSANLKYLRSLHFY